MFNPGIFSIFTMLCTHYHYQIPEHFHHPQKKPSVSPSSPIPPFPGNHKSLDLPSLDILHKWIDTKCGLFVSDSFHLACFPGLSVL